MSASEYRTTKMAKFISIVLDYAMRNPYYSLTTPSVMEIPGIANNYSEMETRSFMSKAASSGIFRIAQVSEPRKEYEMGYVAQGARFMARGSYRAGELAGEGMYTAGSYLGKGVRKAGDFVENMFRKI